MKRNYDIPEAKNLSSFEDTYLFTKVRNNQSCKKDEMDQYKRETDIGSYRDKGSIEVISSKDSIEESDDSINKSNNLEHHNYKFDYVNTKELCPPKIQIND